MKFVKLTSMIIGLFFLLMILVAVCLVTFVNPDRLKPLVAEKIKQRTGLQLAIEGDMSWTLFPYLGVKVDHVILNNPPGFTQKLFAKIDHATIGMRIVPLLHKRIELNGIRLDGMTVNLIKDKNGRLNWDFPLHKKQARFADHHPQTETAINNKPLAISVSSLDIEHSQINWSDERKHKLITLKALSLHANNIALFHPFSLTLSFDFTNNKPARAGHVEVTSALLVDLLKQTLALQDFHLSSALQQNNQLVPLTAAGNIIIDLKNQNLAWNDFNGSLATIPLTGQITVSHLLTIPQLAAHFQLQSFDMKTAFQALGYDAGNIQVSKDVTGDFDINATAFFVNAQGNFKAEQVQINAIKLTNVMVPARYQNGIVELSPVTADLAQGTLQSHIKIDLNKPLPQWAIQTQLNNIQTAQLFADLGGQQKYKLNGNGTIHLQLTSVGKDYATFIKGLQGQGKFALANGSLQGADIGYLVHSARAFLKNKANTTPNLHQTDFGNLQGTLQIHNGVVDNNDLVITSETFISKGKGSIDLSKQTINYILKTTFNGHATSAKKGTHKTVVPLTVQGTLMEPIISIDTGELTKQLTEQKILNISPGTPISKKFKKQADRFLNNFLQ